MRNRRLHSLRTHCVSYGAGDDHSVRLRDNVRESLVSNTDSILDTTKKLLGFESDYTAFDLDIITHINTVFTTLQSLGVGPEEGFMITDKEAVWDEFTGLEMMNSVKSYMFMRVRLMFDPPTTSFHLESLNKMAQEIEWRLSAQAEEVNNTWLTTMPTTSSRIMGSKE
ncbi:hypothetical protein SEA_TEACUP_5 [Arthrobacter phage Teacup]|uniref:Uncharacterized protein n=1 Tax=Arthrobacter phage Teacup TaxID=2015871 RepID=A0A222ZIL2_9CAUD|nr:hypothetical protein QCN31_gp05 [Arthrobacter phage Teacup]ASR84011.1 hypothetical protein SEA_TEACUP_5 [Arthrobacter phage Teacup]